MSSFFDPKIPPGKASPFVTHVPQTGVPLHQSNAAKPATSASKEGREKQPPQAELKKPKVKPVAVTIATAALMLETSARTIRRWIESGQLQCFRVGRIIRIPVSQMAQLMEKRG